LPIVEFFESHAATVGEDLLANLASNTGPVRRAIRINEEERVNVRTALGVFTAIVSGGKNEAAAKRPGDRSAQDASESAYPRPDLLKKASGPPHKCIFAQSLPYTTGR
jgi:hypothetical protein